MIFRNNIYKLFLFIFFFLSTKGGAQILYNNGATIFINGADVKTNGSVENANGIIENNGQFTIDGSMVNGDTLNSYGTITLTNDWENNLYYNSGSGNVILSGDTQTIKGTWISVFYDLTLQGTGIKKLGLYASVNDILTLNDREFATGNFELAVQNPDTGAITRSSGFVSSTGNGKLSRRTNMPQPYLFPVGSTNPVFRYRPVKIKPLAFSSNMFSVRMANTDATNDGFNRSSKDTTLCTINPSYYHRVSHPSGTDPADITFYFDNQQDGNFTAATHWQNIPQWESGIPVSVISNPSPAFSSINLSSWSDFSYEPFALGSDQLIVNIISNNPICSGDSIQVTATSGYTNYDFYRNAVIVQSGSSNYLNVTNPASGDSIYVISNDGPGCTGASDSILIIVNPKPSASISTLDSTTFCEGGSATLVSSSASGNFWLLNDTAAGNSNQNFSTSVSGNYKVVVTTLQGCSDTSNTISITVNPSPNANIIALDTTSFCAEDSVELQSSSIVGNLWYQNNFSTGVATQTYTTTSAGNYMVVVTNGSNCSDTSNTISVTVNPNPIAQITALDTTVFCSGDSVVLQSSSATGNSWHLNNSPTADTNQNLSVTASGDYTTVVTNASGCSDTSDVITVIVNTYPTAAVLSLDTTEFCSGDSAVLQSSSATGNIWYQNNVSTGVTTQNYSASATGDYTVVVTNGSNCSDTSNIISVTVNPGPSALITALDTTVFCAGDSVALQSSNATGNSWHLNNVSTGNSNQTIIIKNSGSYTTVVTNGFGCVDTSKSIFVTVNAQPVVSIFAIDTLVFCAGDSAVLQSSAASGNLWYQNNSPTGITSETFTTTVTGNYYAIVTNGSNCSDTSNTITVTVNPKPNPLIIALDTTVFCTGDSVVLQSSASSGNQWFNTGINTGIISQNITVSGSGNFLTVVTNGFGCTDSSNTMNVTVNPVPSVTVTALDTTEFCQGDSVELQSSSVTGNQWLLNGVPEGQTSQSILVFASGSFSVIVSNSFGCSDTSNAVSVTTNVLPVALITALDTTTFCKGGNATLQSSSATGNTWYYNDTATVLTSQSILISKGGTYKSVVTNLSGCSDTSNSITVVVNDNPSLSVASYDSIVCFGAATGTAALSTSGGIPPYAYLWSTGQTTPSITGLTAGNYSAAVSDGNSCSASETVVISENPVIAITTKITDVTCSGVCNGSAAVTVFGGAPPSLAFVITPLNDTLGPGSDFSAMCSGTYQVIVTDARGCGNSTGFTISGPSAVIASFSVDSVNGYTPLKTSFTDSSTGGVNSWQWDFGDGSTSFLQNPGHTYSDTGKFQVVLKVFSPDGCTDTATRWIRVKPVPENGYFLPNVFSPNGDGKNDFLFIYGNGIESFYIVIYSRWGEKVFSATGGPVSGGETAIGWDGTYKGKTLNPDVYVYYMKIKLYDTPEEIKDGNITLIR